MTDTPRENLTEILSRSRDDGLDGRSTADEIFEAAYTELHRIAAGLMRRERVDHTLQPTALVNEAYCRLVDQPRVSWENRAHFFGIAARAMRQILVDHARHHSAAKRGGEWRRVTLDDALGAGDDRDVGIIDLHDALTRLSERDARMGRVVEMRVFAGMSAKEVGHILGISRRTVQEDWRVAKMWLSRELAEGSGP